MHGEAAVWTKRLRREFGDDRLVVRWNEDLCRFQVGQKLGGIGTTIDWFYTVTDGDDGFRPLDQRAIRKLGSMDKRKHRLKTPEQHRRDVKSAKDEQEEKERAERRYHLRHAAEFYRGRWGFQ